MEMIEKGPSEPISMEALQESKSTNETPQTLGKLSDPHVSLWHSFLYEITRVLF